MHQPPREHSPWWFGIAARPWAPAALAGAILAGRLLWLAFVSPLTLSEDEAHYWLWSQHPGWSYYSKGPGVAWLIAASTAVFGDTQFAVRAPAAVATAVGTIGAAAMARWAGADRVTAFAAALLYACVPALALAGVLMTIDAPYAACWMWAAAFAARAIRSGSRGAWLGLGTAVAIGFLFKYTILLILPGVLLALWATRRERAALRVGTIAASGAVASLGLLPVVLWNADHDWATVRHLLGHLHAPGGDTSAGRDWSFWWPLEFVALQIAVCSRSWPSCARRGMTRTAPRSASVWPSRCQSSLSTRPCRFSPASRPTGPWPARPRSARSPPWAWSGRSATTMRSAACAGAWPSSGAC